jgi:hypothetical protein
MDVPTLDIERTDQHRRSRKGRSRSGRRHRPWRTLPKNCDTLPVKIRTYRIRHEISWDELGYLAFMEKQGWL